MTAKVYRRIVRKAAGLSKYDSRPVVVVPDSDVAPHVASHARRVYNGPCKPVSYISSRRVVVGDCWPWALGV